jgi:hypothetical protein
MNGEDFPSAFPRRRKNTLEYAHLDLGMLSEPARSIQSNFTDVSRLIQQLLKECDLSAPLMRELGMDTKSGSNMFFAVR